MTSNPEAPERSPGRAQCPKQAGSWPINGTALLWRLLRAERGMSAARFVVVLNCKGRLWEQKPRLQRPPR